MKIEEKPKFATPFEWIGGEAQVKALIERFYDLMELEPQYAALRAAHGSTLADARQKLFWFLCGWLGGPQHEFLGSEPKFSQPKADPAGATQSVAEKLVSDPNNSHPMLRARHMPFKIGILERDQWLACMDQAMVETGVDEALRTRLKGSFFQTGDWMRNTPS